MNKRAIFMAVKWQKTVGVSCLIYGFTTLSAFVIARQDFSCHGGNNFYVLLGLVALIVLIVLPVATGFLDRWYFSLPVGIALACVEFVVWVAASEASKMILLCNLGW